MREAKHGFFVVVGVIWFWRLVHQMGGGDWRLEVVFGAATLEKVGVCA